MKKRTVLICSILAVIALALIGCQTWRRGLKDVSSSIGGLDRIVKVYSHDGKIITTYEGRIDIEVNEYGNKVKFDLDGRRVIINNAIVIIEEK